MGLVWSHRRLPPVLNRPKISYIKLLSVIVSKSYQVVEDVEIQQSDPGRYVLVAQNESKWVFIRKGMVEVVNFPAFSIDYRSISSTFSEAVIWKSA